MSLRAAYLDQRIDPAQLHGRNTLLRGFVSDLVAHTGGRASHSHSLRHRPKRDGLVGGNHRWGTAAWAPAAACQALSLYLRDVVDEVHAVRCSVVHPDQHRSLRCQQRQLQRLYLAGCNVAPLLLWHRRPGLRVAQRGRATHARGGGRTGQYP